MAVKLFEIEGIGTVHVYKRRGARSLRLSITADGKIRITVPYGASYATAVDFAKSRSEWIAECIPEETSLLGHGQRVGKAHRLAFYRADVPEPSSRLSGSEIRISRPRHMLASHPDVQAVARKAAIRALRLQTSKLLPVRLKSVADMYGFTFTSVRVKQLKGRWGSCDAQQRIVLNLFLMQLPWDLIDYVLLHELVHTKHLNHGQGFWEEFLRHEPKAKLLRSAIKTHRPVLTAIDT